MAQIQLSEEMRQLMGMERRQFGGLPTAPTRLQRALHEGRVQPAPAQQPARLKRLEERRSLQLFRNHNEMVDALQRAHKLVSRVGATIQSERASSSRAAVNEKARADIYRLDQEMATSLDSIKATIEALDDMRMAGKSAAEDDRHRRRQGR
jgi:hypothetical protein